MTEGQDLDGVWRVESDGSIRASFLVALGSQDTQHVTAYVTNDDRQEAGIQLDGGLVEISPRLTERALAAIEHLATTGRISPHLRLTPLDLAEVVQPQDQARDEKHSDGNDPEEVAS